MREQLLTLTPYLPHWAAGIFIPFGLWVSGGLAFAAAIVLAEWGEGCYSMLLRRRWSVSRSNAQSYCRYCGHTLVSWERVPIFSAPALGWRCRHCRHRIPSIYNIWDHVGLAAGALAGVAGAFYGAGGFLVVVILSVLILILAAMAVVRAEGRRVGRWPLSWPDRRNRRAPWFERRALADLWLMGDAYWLEYRTAEQPARRWGPFGSRAEAVATLREQVLPRPLRRTYRALCEYPFLTDQAREGLRSGYLKPLPSGFLDTFLALTGTQAPELAGALPPVIWRAVVRLRNTVAVVNAEAHPAD